jgi:hypothetical protein
LQEASVAKRIAAVNFDSEEDSPPPPPRVLLRAAKPTELVWSREDDDDASDVGEDFVVAEFSKTVPARLDAATVQFMDADAGAATPAMRPSATSEKARLDNFGLAGTKGKQAVLGIMVGEVS